MKKILLLISIFLLFFVLNPKYTNENDSFLDKVGSGFDELKEMADLNEAKHSFKDFIRGLGDLLGIGTDIPENVQTEIPDLQEPAKQVFAVNNVEIGDSKVETEKKIGTAKRTSFNEYGTNWHTYHENYQHFFMIIYDERDEVAGLYTNQPLLSSKNDITFGTPKDQVRDQLGKPLEGIQKGFTRYLLPEERDYDIFLQNNNYVTMFYDQHDHNKLRAIQIIRADLETEKSDIYAKANPLLMESFEYQLFDLTNAERVKNGLSPLLWDDHVRITARDHSSDMAENGYFNHTNLDGESPFDRMKKDKIFFTSAGENLAYGQTSSIFAHEGLMNSLGHRENILQKNFEYLGVGVAFNSNFHPYFTEKFYAK